MPRSQKQIIQEAPRYLRYYTGPIQSRIIPDTPKARTWSVTERGAIQFDTLSFHRYDLDGKPSTYRKGDFYCRLTNRKPEGPRLAPIFDMLSMIQIYKHKSFDIQSLIFTYISRNVIGMRVRSNVFGIMHGAHYLDKHYDDFANQIRHWAKDVGFHYIDVTYNGRIDIENGPLPGGEFAIPFSWEEFSGELGRSFDQFLRSPRDIPTVKCEQVVDLGPYLDLARARRDEEIAHALRAQWPQLIRLYDPNVASAYGSEKSPSGMECAADLARWLRNNSIHEFRGHDAVKAMEGKFKANHGPHGPGGVIDGLNILMGHSYIRECPFPSFEYPCRRISPWFLTSPALFNPF